MSPELEALKAKVAEAVTVEESAAILLAGLKAKLDAAIAELAAQGVVNESLNQLSTDLGTGTTDLQTAITASTPAETTGG